jgi:hypothetical protein
MDIKPIKPQSRLHALRWGIYRLWRRIEYLVFFVFLLSAFAYFALQSERVQNYLVGKVTNYLSAELKTTVSLGRVSFQLFDNLVLQDLFIADLEGDTLLYAGALSAGLESGLFQLLQQNISFDDIGLSDARIRVTRKTGAKETNAQFLLDYFIDNSHKSANKPDDLILKINNLEINNVKLEYDDQAQGSRIDLSLPLCKIKLRKFDNLESALDIRSVIVDGLDLRLRQFSVKNPSEEKVNSIKEASTQAKPLKFHIASVNLKHVSLGIDNDKEGRGAELVPGLINYDHLFLDNLNLSGSNIRGSSDGDLTCKVAVFTARERSGFEIKSGRVGRLVFNNQSAAMYGFNIQTAGGTELGDTIEFRYNKLNDLKRMEPSVKSFISLHEGNALVLADLRYFSSQLFENRELKLRSQTKVQLSGDFNGSKQSFNGEHLQLQIGDAGSLRASFSADNLGEESSRFHMKISELSANMNQLDALIPGVKMPQQVVHLGNVRYEGYYDIFFNTDHQINGRLSTDLGSGHLDLKVDLKDGVEQAKYSGLLDMKDLDVAALSGNPDFGKSSFSIRLKEGSSGLTARRMDMKLEGRVDTFHYKGYAYRNIRLEGGIQDRVFDGDLSVSEDNIDFQFSGGVNFRDSISRLAFTADVRCLDLRALNFTREDIVLSGQLAKIDLNLKNINDLRGLVSIRDIEILQDHTTRHFIEYIQLSSVFDKHNQNSLLIESPVADANIQGEFDINTLRTHILQMLARYHPEFAAQLNYPLQDTLQLTDRFSMDVKIKNTARLAELFDKSIQPVRNIDLKATVDGKQSKTSIALWVPELEYAGVQVKRAGLIWESKKDIASYSLNVPIIQGANGSRYPSVFITGNMTRNFMNLRVAARDSTQNAAIKGLNLNARLSVKKGMWELGFEDSNVFMFNEHWSIAENNIVRFNRSSVYAENLEFAGTDNKRISLYGDDGKGLSFGLTNFNLDFFNRFLDEESAQIRGKIFDFEIRVKNVFELSGIQGFFSTDTVFVNGTPYGNIGINVDMENTDSPIVWSANLLTPSNQQVLRIAGGYLPNNLPEHALGKEVLYVNEEEEDYCLRPGKFVTQINAPNMPMEILETIIPDISKTSGELEVDVFLDGNPNRPNMFGFVTIKEGQIQIDYLKAMFHIKNQVIEFNDRKIGTKEEGAEILDATQKNVAIIKGGLKHDFFRKWKIDCTIKSRPGENFAIMNTQFEDNNMYYGQGLGAFEAKFTGNFARTDINITATTGKDCKLYIPLTTNSDVKKVEFIKYLSQDTVNQSIKSNKKIKNIQIGDPKGIAFNLELNITEDAVIQMIFDEQAGDIIQGRGAGNLRIGINRAGEFTMTGKYRISQGQYLFTFLNVINKQFKVAQGGEITWTGDPYHANIKLAATYEVETSVYNLIQQELQVGGNAQEDLVRAARDSRPSLVTMYLNGDLMRPDISFDLSFPTASGNIKTYLDTKMRLLRQDQNELNRQVFGLVVMGVFLPDASNIYLQSSDYVASAFNTLSQVLSNQFSNQLSSFVAEWLGGKVSNVDFDIAYNQYRNTLNNPNSSAEFNRELQVKVSGAFADERFKIQVGANIDVGGSGAADPTRSSSGFLGEDVTLIWGFLPNSKHISMKIYQRTEPDNLGLLRGRYGLGLKYQRDFDSWSDLINAPKSTLIGVQ